MKSTVAPMPGSSSQKTDARAGKYLTFRLEKQEFAIQVPRIREIMSVQPIMPVPLSPSYVRGVMNLRGKLIPVIDLRAKLGMAQAESTARSSIIVAQIDCEAGRMQMGTLVDCVTEVLTLEARDIDDPAPAGGKPYLLGTAKVKGRIKTLLDINVVLTPEEIRDLEAVLEAA